ncbi:hypothetical protein QQF64_006496 [Cirrhinus molitorella]|uniref:Uncharacterized protein n=1 Tax=Cirrhinus molitorella TaxID=172907 RepID=A0ABR3MII7_9TELE
MRGWSHLRVHQPIRTHAFIPLLFNGNIDRCSENDRHNRASSGARSPEKPLRAPFYTGGVATRGSHAHVGPRSRNSSMAVLLNE